MSDNLLAAFSAVSVDVQMGGKDSMRNINLLSQAQSEIRKIVESAFGKKPPPDAEEIIDSLYPEPLAVRDLFGGKGWWEITLEILKTDYPSDESACLSFMSPKGRNYYLPTYLLFASEYYWKGGDTPLELSSRLLMYAQSDCYYQISALTNEQMRAVAQVLQFLMEEYDDEDALEALDFLWKKYLPQPWHNSP